MNLSWRLKRQLIIASTVLAFLGVTIFLVIIGLRPEPSCFDNKKNQGETEIDCGVPCAPCELKHPKEITIFWQRAVKVKDNTYDVAAFIKNPNEVIGSADLEYEFNLYDESGLLARRSGRTFIFPREELNIIEANISTPRPLNRTEFKINNVRWEVSKETIPNLVVQKKDYRIVTGTDRRKQSTIESVILNNASFDFRRAEINFLLLDKDENIIGANKTVIDNFLSGSSREVKSLWPRLLEGVVSSVIVEPRINMFDPTVILRPR